MDCVYTDKDGNFSFKHSKEATETSDVELMAKYITKHMDNKTLNSKEYRDGANKVLQELEAKITSIEDAMKIEDEQFQLQIEDYKRRTLQRVARIEVLSESVAILKNEKAKNSCVITDIVSPQAIKHIDELANKLKEIQEIWDKFNKSLSI